MGQEPQLTQNDLPKGRRDNEENMKIMILVVAVLAAASANASAQVDFDRGLSVNDFAAQAVTAAPQLPEAKAAGIPSYTVPDCKKAEFTAGGALEASLELRSLEMYQDCQNFGAPVGQICTPRPEYHSALAKVTLNQAPALLPGQKEKFEVCLNGPFLSLRQDKKNAYTYEVKRQLDAFLLTPQAADKGFFWHHEQPADACTITVDNGYYCVYRCKDGSFLSKPNPFPVIPSPNQWVGPIYTPCAPAISNLPVVKPLL